MEFNPVLEGRKKVEALFKKFEDVLQENDVVIGTLMAKQYKTDLNEVEKDLVSVS